MRIHKTHTVTGNFQIQENIKKDRNDSQDVEQDFPGGPVGKESVFHCRDSGSVPDQGPKIPHAPGQLLSSCATPKT